MRLIRGVLPAVFFCISSQALAAEPVSPCRHFTEDLRERMVATVHDAGKNFEQKRAVFKELFQQALDMDWIGQQVAGSYWNNASPQDHKAYLQAYVAFLSDFYISGFDEEDIGDIVDVLLTKFKERAPKHYIARVQINQKQDTPLEVEFELAENPAGTCYVQDFTTEGISMLDTQRAEILSLGEKGGLPYITERLNAHLRKN